MVSVAPTLNDPDPAFAAPNDTTMVRLWQGFMTARVAIAMVLLLLHATVFLMGIANTVGAMLLCAVYLLVCLGVRLVMTPPGSSDAFVRQWPLTIGVDVVGCAALQFSQSAGINYVALFALPVLLASVLGTRTFGLATASAVTLLLFAQALGERPHAEAAYLQAALVGTGLMAVALLARQLARRLARQEQLTQQSALAAQAQSRVNELIVENLPDGILVVNRQGVVQAANPAARRMLARQEEPADEVTGAALPITLFADAAWYPLATLVHETLTRQTPRSADVTLNAIGSTLRLRASTRLTSAHPSADAGLCVLFLQDLRELEAQMRNDSLVSMGRMSTAVAHEIRNPLAAIVQANALLGEDLLTPQHQRLTQMIQHNAQRLDQIVEEVLNLSRIHQPGDPTPTVPLDAQVQHCCHEWMQHNHPADRVTLQLAAASAVVAFDADHLRRVLINLLDNAHRYATGERDAVVVSTSAVGRWVNLSVWSAAAPLERSVERHLFEPFFSSESRSTGLGLYICRELCEQHGARIAYRRRAHRGTDGNDFSVQMQRLPTPVQPAVTASPN